MSADPICYCPRCGQPMETEFHEGKLVTARCVPGRFELPSELVEAIDRCFLHEEGPPGRIEMRNNWGAPWFCPRDGTRAIERFGPFDCPTCERQLDGVVGWISTLRWRHHAVVADPEGRKHLRWIARMPLRIVVTPWEILGAFAGLLLALGLLPFERDPRPLQIAVATLVFASLGLFLAAELRPKFRDRLIDRHASAEPLGAAEQLGWLYIRNHCGTAATGLFAEIVAREPGRASAWLGMARGSLGWHIGDPVIARLAARFCRRALREAPRFAPARELLASLAQDHPECRDAEPFEGDLAEYLAMIGYSSERLDNASIFGFQPDLQLRAIDHMVVSGWPLFLPCLEKLATTHRDERVRAAAREAIDHGSWSACAPSRASEVS